MQSSRPSIRQSGARRTLATHTFADGALSRDGRYAAFTDATDEPRAIVVDLATGKRVLSLDGSTLGQQNAFVRGLSADGSLMLYGDRPVKIIRVSTGEVTATLPQSACETYNAQFGPSGSTLYTSGRDATLRVWDAETGQPLFVEPAAGSGHPSGRWMDASS